MTEKYLNFVKNMNAYSRNSVKPKVCQKKKNQMIWILSILKM